MSKRYGSNVAVDELSFEVQTGEVFGLLGPNGAGKTTTLHMLTGLVRPTSGTITVYGKDLRRNRLAVAGRMGVLVERPSFYEHLTVRANLALHARLARREVTIDKVLDLVRLLPVADRKARTLSLGMRQRLGLATAMLTEPELLILDEPANGLDPEATREILNLLKALAGQSRVTIVFSTHMLHEVEGLCDRVAIINNGRLVACDRTDNLVSYDKTDVEVLLDAPEAAAKRLANQYWVEQVEVFPNRIQVKMGEPDVHQLTAFLVANNHRISGVIPRRRTLQDYFLKVLNR